MLLACQTARSCRGLFGCMQSCRACWCLHATGVSVMGLASTGSTGLQARLWPVETMQKLTCAQAGCSWGVHSLQQQ